MLRGLKLVEDLDRAAAHIKETEDEDNGKGLVTQTEKDDSNDRIWEHETACSVIQRYHIAKANGENCHVAEVKRIRVRQVIDLGEDGGSSGKPEEEHHGLENKGSLIVV